MSAPIDISEDAFDMSSKLLTTALTCPVCREILSDNFGQGTCWHLACMSCWEAMNSACWTCNEITLEPRQCGIIGAVLKAYPRKAPCGVVFFSKHNDHFATCISCCNIRSEKTLADFRRESEKREAELKEDLRKGARTTTRLVAALKRHNTSDADITAILQEKRPRLRREEERKEEDEDADTEDAQRPNY